MPNQILKATQKPLTYVNASWMLKESTGYYVLFASTTDMYKKENAIMFGKAYNKETSTMRPKNRKVLSYLKVNSNKVVRLYDSRRLHRWYSDSDCKNAFPEFFI